MKLEKDPAATEIKPEILEINTDQINIETSSTNEPADIITSNNTDATTNPTSNQENTNNQAKKSICGVCYKDFESRSKLFNHIKEEGHAAPKISTSEQQPLSHNSVKRNKRLANKTKK